MSAAASSGLLTAGSLPGCLRLLWSLCTARRTKVALIPAWFHVLADSWLLAAETRCPAARDGAALWQRCTRRQPVPKSMEVAPRIPTRIPSKGWIPSCSVDSAAGVAQLLGRNKEKQVTAVDLQEDNPSASRQAPGDASRELFSSYSVNRSACWTLGRNIPTSVLQFLCQHLSPAPYGHVVFRK